MDLWDGTGGPGPLAPLRRLGARAIALIGEPVTFGAPPEGVHRLLGAARVRDERPRRRGDAGRAATRPRGRRSFESLYVLAART